MEKEMATHSNVLAWRIPGTGEPGGLPSMWSHRVRHDWSDLAAAAAEASDHSWLAINTWQAYSVPLIPADEPSSGKQRTWQWEMLMGRHTCRPSEIHHNSWLSYNYVSIALTQLQLKDCTHGSPLGQKTKASSLTFALSLKELFNDLHQCTDLTLGVGTV